MSPFRVTKTKTKESTRTHNNWSVVASDAELPRHVVNGLNRFGRINSTRKRLNSSFDRVGRFERRLFCRIAPIVVSRRHIGRRQEVGDGRDRGQASFPANEVADFRWAENKAIVRNWLHRDRSIQIEMASQLHDARMTRDRWLNVGHTSAD